MIPIILKIILCATLLIALYYLFLEKEKMHQFNRFYLIFSLVFSYVIPFITITTEFPKPSNNPQLIFEEATQQLTILPSQQESFNWMNVIWIVYGIVTCILLIKGIISVVQINNLKGKEINYQGLQIKITNENLSPFSFWKTIYLGNNYFKNNEIDSRIFLHEKGHLKQKHSIDLLLIEILKIITWFNPVLYFYKKAMVTNHEFLADEYVLKNNYNIKDYQNLILDELISGQNYNLTHTFNFNNTKKRFIMMNRKKTRLVGFKKVISIPILVVAFGLFVQKTYANDSNPTIPLLSKKAEAKKTQNGTSVQQIVEDTKQLLENKEVKHTNEEKQTVDTIRPKSKTSLSESVQPKQETVAITAESENIINPVYPGGINQLRKNIANTFDSSKVGPSTNKAPLKSEIQYVINKEGSIEHIMTKGENEIFNNEVKTAFLKANDGVKWQPATKDGAVISYTMRLPITMSFQ
ncbi:M56 family metallopeptidase [Chryseobacterium polytrichastri]|uniref:Signal transducer regulating beta-lactamase production, contains metallopeptidase domain n=1 Tax=Chryseobacterium polytrichastri TaxID=1302687 RepID=A0A1M7K561_9FLAO|nr:M56 family metallopeptidase [Chryseobacterium polytrichastri]SHM60442.1 Signal transducer regulating beta-lactamase production, contains metallopeptidase domain [Chryseobacterium polytrichastri]